MEDSYYRLYPDLYSRHWWWRAREEIIRRSLARILPCRENLAILNIGCGNGFFFDHLETLGQVEGVEPFLEHFPPPEPHRVIHHRPWNREIDLGCRFDLILALDVLEHVADEAGFLDGVVRHLNPGGRFLLTVPAFRALWTAHDDLNRHLRRYTPMEIRRRLEECGMVVETLSPFFLALGILKSGLHLWETLFPPSSPALPGIGSPAVNRILARCFVLEYLLARHLPLSFGSSLLCVARWKSPLPTNRRDPS